MTRPYAEFVLRLEAAALRQLLAIEAFNIGSGGGGERGAMKVTFLESTARGG